MSTLGAVNSNVDSGGDVYDDDTGGTRVNDCAYAVTPVHTVVVRGGGGGVHVSVGIAVGVGVGVRVGVEDDSNT